MKVSVQYLNMALLVSKDLSIAECPLMIVLSNIVQNFCVKSGFVSSVIKYFETQAWISALIVYYLISYIQWVSLGNFSDVSN